MLHVYQVDISIRQKKAERRGKVVTPGLGIQTIAEDGTANIELGNPITTGAIRTSPSSRGSRSTRTGSVNEDGSELMMEFDEFLSATPPPGTCELSPSTRSTRMPSQTLSTIELDCDSGFAMTEKLQDRFAEVMALKEKRASDNVVGPVEASTA